MSKKTAQPKAKIVYKTSPVIIFFIFLLCAVSLYVVLYQNFLINQMALSDRIQIMQRTHQMVFPGDKVTVTVTPMKMMDQGY